MSRDDRDRPGEPADDEPVGQAEQVRAEAFGKWLDDLSAGEPLPPAMDSEDRALLETATMIAASSRAVDLAPERVRRLVDEALESAVLEPRTEDELGPADARVGQDLDRPAFARSGRPDAREDAAARSSTDLVLSGGRRADRVLRHLPWAVASLAAAAAVVLFIARPKQGPRGAQLAPIVRHVHLRAANTSRPADPLVGIIAREDAGGARERIDILFADRMDGYRDLRLRRALGEEQP